MRRAWKAASPGTEEKARKDGLCGGRPSALPKKKEGRKLQLRKKESGRKRTCNTGGGEKKVRFPPGKNGPTGKSY